MRIDNTISKSTNNGRRECVLLSMWSTGTYEKKNYIYISIQYLFLDYVAC